MISTKHHDQLGVRRGGVRFRRLTFERCEDRCLLSAAPPTAHPDFQVHFRMEVTDELGVPVTAVEVGQQFAINIYAVDQRPAPQGVFAAYLDVLFDDSQVERLGNVTFGDSYTNAIALGGGVPGVLDEVGAVVSLFDRDRDTDAVADALLFRAHFRATDPGAVTFLTDPADRFPDSYVLLLGTNEPVRQSDIHFDSKTLNITSRSFPLLFSAIEPNHHEIRSASRSPTFDNDVLHSDPFSWGRFSTSRINNLGGTFELTRPTLAANGIDAIRENEPDALAYRWLLERSSSILSRDRAWQLNIDRTPDWIELPFRSHLRTQSFSLPISPESQRLPTDKWHHADLRHDDVLGIEDWGIHSDTDWRIGRRSFLRMSWENLQPRVGESEELLAAQMIDIDAVFADAADLEFFGLEPEEWIANRQKDDASQERDELESELRRLSIHLRAGRSKLLAFEVGVKTPEPSAAEHSRVPPVNADAEQADAGPPKPNSERERTAEDPA